MSPHTPRRLFILVSAIGTFLVMSGAGLLSAAVAPPEPTVPSLPIGETTTTTTTVATTTTSDPTTTTVPAISTTTITTVPGTTTPTTTPTTTTTQTTTTTTQPIPATTGDTTTTIPAATGTGEGPAGTDGQASPLRDADSAGAGTTTRPADTDGDSSQFGGGDAGTTTTPEVRVPSFGTEDGGLAWGIFGSDPVGQEETKSKSKGRSEMDATGGGLEVDPMWLIAIGGGLALLLTVIGVDQALYKAHKRKPLLK